MDPNFDPLMEFQRELDNVQDLSTVQSIYSTLGSKAGVMSPEREKAREMARQRMAQLTQEDTGNLTAPINRGMKAIAGSLGFTMTHELPPVEYSKSAVSRGIGTASDVLGGVGLALLSAGEGWRGRPLTATHLQEIGLNRERLAEESRRHDIQDRNERLKQFRNDTKDAMEYAKNELATIRTFKGAAEQGDANAKQHLAESRRESERLYPNVGGAIWDRMYKQPDATAGMLDALAQGHYDTTFGRATSLGQIGKPLLDIMGNDKLMALNELRYIHDKGKVDKENGSITVKDKQYERVYTEQEINDLRKRGGMQTSAEVSKGQSEAQIASEQAKQSSIVEPEKTAKVQEEVKRLKRELSQQDLEEYTKLYDRAIKLAGGSGMNFSFGAGGELSNFSIGDTKGLDEKKLVSSLRHLADTAPGISDKTRLALHRAAAAHEGEGTSGKTNLKSILEEEKRKAGIGK